MIKPRVKLTGAKVFTNRLNRYVNNLQDDLNEMAKTAGQQTLTMSLRRVPIDTGQLLRSSEQKNKANGKVVTASVEYGNDSTVKYASYQEFGVGKGMKWLGEYSNADVKEFAKQFSRNTNNKNAYTKQQPYLLISAFMAKRNLERKVNTLAKKL